MRTTISFDDETLAQARNQALAQQVSLNRYIESAVREKLASEVREPAPTHRSLKTFAGTGVRPGIDLNDSSGLLDTLDTPL